MRKNRHRTASELLTASVLLTIVALACGPRNAELAEPAAAPNPAPPSTVKPEPPELARAETPPATPPSVVPKSPASEPLALRFVSPNIGPAAGGNDVTIDGRGFADYPQITFGGAHAWIRSVTPTEIRVTVPAPTGTVAAGDTLIVDVTVTNPPDGSGPIAQTLTRSYSYVSSEPPEQVAAAEPPTTAAPPAATAPPAAAPSPIATPSPATDSEPEPSAEAPSVGPPGLIASFSFELLTDSEGCPPPGTAIRFTDRSSGATEWWWDFGDGETSKERHNNHCYSAPGMRSVSLTVSNDDGSVSTSKIVTAGM